jgi:hypothetical protein
VRRILDVDDKGIGFVKRFDVVDVAQHRLASRPSHDVSAVKNLHVVSKQRKNPPKGILLKSRLGLMGRVTVKAVPIETTLKTNRF